MREERLEVSVTFDERHGYVPARPSCGRPSWRSAWAACAAASRLQCCPITSASCFISMVSPSANVIGAGRRRS